jgi:hypothetical protein
MNDTLVSRVEHWLDRLYVAAEGATLRKEERRKALELAPMLLEIDRMLRRFSSRAPIVLVDAAAGKSYLGLLAAKLILEPIGLSARVITIEQDPGRVERSRHGAASLGTEVTDVVIDCRCSDVADPNAWPHRPTVVAALHACGPAADAIIDWSIATEAKGLLLVPCCTSNAVAAAVRALESAERLGIPRHAAVRRRFVQAVVDAGRTRRLEAAGYETEVVEFVGATITPHNLLWRARRVCEPSRMAAARKRQAAWNELTG